MKAMGYVRVSTGRRSRASHSRPRSQDSRHGHRAGSRVVRGHRGRRGIGQEPEPSRPAPFGRPSGQRQSRGGDYCQTRPAPALRQGRLQFAGTLREAHRRVDLDSGIVGHGSAAGRLAITIMAAVSQWERELIGDRTRDSLRHKRTRGTGREISGLDSVLARTESMWSQILASKMCSPKSVTCARAASD